MTEVVHSRSDHGWFHALPMSPTIVTLRYILNWELLLELEYKKKTEPAVLNRLLQANSRLPTIV